jgi:hypothetical protein
LRSIGIPFFIGPISAPQTAMTVLPLKYSSGPVTVASRQASPALLPTSILARLYENISIAPETGIPKR